MASPRGNDDLWKVELHRATRMPCRIKRTPDEHPVTLKVARVVPSTRGMPGPGDDTFRTVVAG
jgi:hypothetical protein